MEPGGSGEHARGPSQKQLSQREGELHADSASGTGRLRSASVSSWRSRPRPCRPTCGTTTPGTRTTAPTPTTRSSTAPSRSTTWPPRAGPSTRTGTSCSRDPSRPTRCWWTACRVRCSAPATPCPCDRVNGAGSVLTAGANPPDGLGAAQSVRWANNTARRSPTTCGWTASTPIAGPPAPPTRSTPSACGRRPRPSRASTTSAHQLTVLLLQNPTDYTIDGTVFFWDVGTERFLALARLLARRQGAAGLQHQHRAPGLTGAITDHPRRPVRRSPGQERGPRAVDGVLLRHPADLSAALGPKADQPSGPGPPRPVSSPPPDRGRENENPGAYQGGADAVAQVPSKEEGLMNNLSMPFRSRLRPLTHALGFLPTAGRWAP